MGKLVVTIGIGDQQGRQFEDLEVTVDTGSTFTAVPRALLQRLEVVTLEDALLAVDPVGQRLVPVEAERL